MVIISCEHCQKQFKRKWATNRFCSKRCAMCARRAPLHVRFWRFVKKTRGCWLWTGCLEKGGYGQLARDGHSNGIERAHRVSWEIHFGPIPKGKDVLHKCDVRKCVKPKHFFLGTNVDNVRDMVSKGRHGFGHHQGEAHGMAKLTAKKVRQIVRDFKRGNVTKIALGKKYGVTDVMVGRIIAKKAWVHLWS